MNSEHRKTFEQFQDASSLQEVLQIFPEARELANPDVTQQPMRYDVFIYRFMQFFEAATHLILYERQLYPRAVFATARKFGTGVKMATAPQIARHIQATADMVGRQVWTVRTCAGRAAAAPR